MELDAFAVIDGHSGEVRVIGIHPADHRHETLDVVGWARDRRHATKLLTGVGWRTRGSWRTSADGDCIRTIDSQWLA